MTQYNTLSAKLFNRNLMIKNWNKNGIEVTFMFML